MYAQAPPLNLERHNLTVAIHSNHTRTTHTHTMPSDNRRYAINTDDIILCIVALFLPPLAVAWRKGFWSKYTLLNVLLCMTMALPGQLHAWYVIYMSSEERRDYTLIHEQRNGYDSLDSPDLEAGLQEEEPHVAAGVGQSSSEPPRYEDVVQKDSPSASTDNKIQRSH